jgi:hypothetical protein
MNWEVLGRRLCGCKRSAASVAGLSFELGTSRKLNGSPFVETPFSLLAGRRLSNRTMRALDPPRRGTQHVRVGQPWRQEVEPLGDASRKFATSCDRTPLLLLLPPQFQLLSTFSSVVLSLLFSCSCFPFHFIDFLFQLCIVLLSTCLVFFVFMNFLVSCFLILLYASSLLLIFSPYYISPPSPCPTFCFLHPPTGPNIYIREASSLGPLMVFIISPGTFWNRPLLLKPTCFPYQYSYH